MKAKDKALDLVVRLFQSIPDYAIEENKMAYGLAKQCATITIEELIKESKRHDELISDHARTGYLMEVKQEIEKL